VPLWLMQPARPTRWAHCAGADMRTDKGWTHNLGYSARQRQQGTVVNKHTVATQTQFRQTRPRPSSILPWRPNIEAMSLPVWSSSLQSQAACAATPKDGVDEAQAAR